MSTNAYLEDLSQRAAEILATPATAGRYPNSCEAIGATPCTPALPETRADATPHILFMGPFKDEPDRVAVALYVGVGFIEIRNLDDSRYTYEFSVIGGDGIEERDAYLQAAFRLYFNDVKTLQPIEA